MSNPENVSNKAVRTRRRGQTIELPTFPTFNWLACPTCGGHHMRVEAVEAIIVRDNEQYARRLWSNGATDKGKYQLSALDVGGLDISTVATVFLCLDCKHEKRLTFMTLRDPVILPEYDPDASASLTVTTPFWWQGGREQL